MERFRARVATSLPAGSATPAATAPPAIDLKALAIPIIGINGAFDSPYAKTHRFWREATVFQNGDSSRKDAPDGGRCRRPHASRVRGRNEPVHRPVRPLTQPTPPVQPMP
jgi:hypothetical protein